MVKTFIVLLLSNFYAAYITHTMMILWITWKSLKNHLNSDNFWHFFVEIVIMFFQKVWNIFFTFK